MKKWFWSIVLALLLMIGCAFPVIAVEPETDVLTISDISFQFSDSREAFRHPPWYSIPLRVYHQIFGRNALAKMLYNTFEDWNGYGYGMVTAAGLLYQPGNGINAFNFWSGASKAADLDPYDTCGNLSLTEFIEMMEISVLSKRFMEVENQNMNDLSALYTEISKLKNTKLDPPVICVYKKVSEESGWLGRALLAYAVENVSTTETRVKVYDPNYPMEERYLSLNKSEDSGQFTGWNYSPYDTEVWRGESDLNDTAYQITYVPYSTYATDWANLGNLGGQVDSSPSGSFTDVSESNYFHGPVIWAIKHGITNGTTSSTFSPHNDCTRQQILTFLWRASGCPNVAIETPFSDVSTDDYFSKAAAWAYEKELVLGENFNGTAPCTRAEAVTYLWKLAGSPYSSRNRFSDIGLYDESAKAISWAVDHGITNGTSESTFSPDSICTRAQIVTFLYRYYGTSYPYQI